MNTNKIYAESIVNEYFVKEERKVVALKKLNRKVKLPPQVLAYSLGSLSALVFGSGMCLSMGVLGGELLPYVITGIVLGITGIALMIGNYFAYKSYLSARKKKYASDIIFLAEQVAKEEE